MPRRRRYQQEPSADRSIRDAISEITKQVSGSKGGPAPIGVKRGFEAATQRRYTDQGTYPRVLNMPPIPGYASQAAKQAPRYYEDDQYAPANFSGDIITKLQQELALVGLFDEEAEIIPGDWGEDTAKAYKKLLAYANQHGMTWRAALNNLRSQVMGGGGPGGGGGGGRYKIDEFGNLVPLDALPQRAPLVTRTTDPRTVELVLRETAMNLLGQALSPDQVKNMTSAYNQMEIARQQEAYDKELTGGSVVDIPSPQAFSQAEVEAKFPEEAQNYRGLTYMSDAMQMLASPAWGLR
jgi:hypothetical protein